MFGNSSREETPISFPNFAGHAFARLLPFFVYLSGTPASMGEDLAKLVSMVAAGKLKPEIGFEDSWHNVYKAAAALRDRKVNGKAVFHIITRPVGADLSRTPANSSALNIQQLTLLHWLVI